LTCSPRIAKIPLAMADMTAEQVLRHCSDELLSDASRKDGVDVASCAYSAGYAALLGALSPAERQRFQDHPATQAALIGARKLRLSSADTTFACRGARHYYASNRDALIQSADCLAWALRVREAAGWSTARRRSRSLPRPSK
jgi:hypothetical protein